MAKMTKAQEKQFHDLTVKFHELIYIKLGCKYQQSENFTAKIAEIHELTEPEEPNT